MTEMKRDFLIAAAISAVALIAFAASSNISSVPAPEPVNPVTGSPVQPDRGGPPSPETCRRIQDAVARGVAAANGGLANPGPGVIVVHPSAWAITDQKDRAGALQLYAAQKACATGSSVSLVSVEVRSLLDNRLIGSGPYWNFEEAD